MNPIPFILAFLVLSFSTALSQDKKVGLTLQVSNPIRDTKVGWFDVDMESIDGYNIKDRSFALGVLGSYKLSTSTIRMRINYMKIDIIEYRTSVGIGIRTKETSTGNQNKVTIAPGITWTLNKEKVDFYAGMELPLTIHGKFLFDGKTIATDSTSGNLLGINSVEFKIPKGYSIGIGGIFGVNYFISSNFSVGVEFSPSILYSSLGGAVETKYSTGIPPPTQNVEAEDEDKFQGFTHYENRFSFGVSFWLK